MQVFVTGKPQEIAAFLFMRPEPDCFLLWQEPIEYHALTLEADQPHPLDRLIQEERRRLLLRSLAAMIANGSLTGQESAILALRVLYGFRHEEIARRLGMNEQSVRARFWKIFSRVHRWLARLGYCGN
jgi:DNA-directed RNA polymerase specialized sigma24 family protein